MSLVVFRDKEQSAETTVTLGTREVRRIHIKHEDLEAYGHTKGCPRYESALQRPQ